MKFWTWLKKWAWLVLAVCAFILGIVITICLGRGRQHSEPVTNFTRKAVEKVQEIEDKGEEEKARVRSEAEGERKGVEEIREDKDPARRRKKLANWIADNL